MLKSYSMKRYVLLLTDTVKKKTFTSRNVLLKSFISEENSFVSYLNISCNDIFLTSRNNDLRNRHK